jgi:hypothetical protein
VADLKNSSSKPFKTCGKSGLETGLNIRFTERLGVYLQQ